MFAASPEEPETLLEDTVLLGDQAAVASLSSHEAVLTTGSRAISPEQALPELATLG